MSSKTFKATIVREGSTCFIPLTFDPKSVFGKVRAPVRVTAERAHLSEHDCLDGRSAIHSVAEKQPGGRGLEGGETIEVQLELDTEKREIKPPADFVRALKSAPPAWEGWRALSYSHQREHVEAIEEARKPETRARRIERATRMIAATQSSKG